MGWIRTSITSSGSSSERTTRAPTTTPRSWGRAKAELVEDLLTAIDHPVTKVLAVGEPPIPIEVVPAAREHFADEPTSRSRTRGSSNPTRWGVSKGRAVRWLARRLRIPLGATLAIGYQWNDLEMLAEVGHGAAMPTAPDGVRALARYVAPPLEDEGAAQVIEQLVLANPAEVLAASQRLSAEADERRRRSA